MFPGKQYSLFPGGPFIIGFVIPPNLKIEKENAKKSFAWRRLTVKFAAVLRSTT